MQSISRIHTEDYDLTCPITLRTFRDPVKAADGHTYEREAIVKWITVHGTSPLTRQVLDVNGLLSDHHMREKVGQRTSSAGPSDVKYEPVIYQNAWETPIHHQGRIIKGASAHRTHDERCCRRRCCSLTVVLSALILLVCGVTVSQLTRKYSDRFLRKILCDSTCKVVRLAV